LPRIFASPAAHPRSTATSRSPPCQWAIMTTAWYEFAARRALSWCWLPTMSSFSRVRSSDKMGRELEQTAQHSRRPRSQPPRPHPCAQSGVILDRLKFELGYTSSRGRDRRPAPSNSPTREPRKLAEPRVRKERGEPIDKIDLGKGELRFVPDASRRFSGARTGAFRQPGEACQTGSVTSKGWRGVAWTTAAVMPLPRPLPARDQNLCPWRRHRGPRIQSRPSRRCPRSGSRP
jgi:hypothetical protein